MKILVCLKTPDAVDYAIQDVLDRKRSILEDEGLTGDILEAKLDEVKEKAEAFLKSYFRYGEMATLEFDTEANTAKVLQV
jgi:hypothetical protein